MNRQNSKQGLNNQGIINIFVKTLISLLTNPEIKL